MEQQQLFVQMALNAWHTQVSRTEKFINALDDDALLKEVAPGKNRIIYILGHLIAVNDALMTLLGLGERSYAHLDEAFLKNPDKSAGLHLPEASQLRKDWEKSNAALTASFNKMPAAEWFTRHTAVSEEDFLKEPTRNKLNVLLNRTNHLAYHLGQLVLAKYS